MVFTKHKMFAPAVLITCLLVFSASPILAQDTTNPAGSRTVASGQKMKLKGVVTRRDSDTFTVRDMNGMDTVVRLDDRTSVKTKGGFLRGGTNYAQTSILRGLNLEIEGRGNGSGELLLKRSGSTKQTCALHARSNRERRHSKRELLIPKINLLRLKRMPNGFQANWKNWLPFRTPPEAVRKPHRQLLMQPSPV